MAAGARQMRPPGRCTGPARVGGRGAVSVATLLRRRPRSALARAASSSTDAAAAAATGTGVCWTQKTVTLPEKRRGVHLVTRDVLDQLPELASYDVGLANLHLLHTSAGLSINENACASVRRDMEAFFDALVPDGPPRGKGRYAHDDEGPDDMPSHIKGVLTGFTLTVPISRGRLALGTWQGLYLFETRDRGGPRSIVVTLQGSKRADGRAYA